jgi:hypothetical protein
MSHDRDSRKHVEYVCRYILCLGDTGTLGDPNSKALDHAPFVVGSLRTNIVKRLH